MAATTATPAAAPAPAQAPAQKAAREKFTFMLHNPTDMTSEGKYCSSDYRYAALKCASKGVTDILLRKTNTKEIREFKGQIVDLPEPKQINRGDRVISYTRKPTVKFVRKWLYEGPEVQQEGSTSTKGEASPDAPAEEVIPASVDKAPPARKSRKKSSEPAPAPAPTQAPAPPAAEPAAKKRAPRKAANKAQPAAVATA